jgi:hypothetical protein
MPHRASGPGAGRKPWLDGIRGPTDDAAQGLRRGAFPCQRPAWWVRDGCGGRLPRFDYQGCDGASNDLTYRLRHGCGRHTYLGSISAPGERPGCIGPLPSQAPIAPAFRQQRRFPSAARLVMDRRQAVSWRSRKSPPLSDQRICAVGVVPSRSAGKSVAGHGGARLAETGHRLLQPDGESCAMRNQGSHIRLTCRGITVRLPFPGNAAPVARRGHGAEHANGPNRMPGTQFRRASCRPRGLPALCFSMGINQKHGDDGGCRFRLRSDPSC